MAILNYSTSISCEKTISEIQKCLVRHGAIKIITDYTGETPTAVTFCLKMDNNLVAFSLPANYDGVLKAMDKDKKVPRKFINKEQALKVSWRIIKDWIEAQCAIVEAKLVDITEVFLPYAITKNGNTLYKEIQSTGLLMLQSNNDHY